MMRRGQVALYLLMVLVGIFLLALLNVDAFIAVRTKNRVQNAGDAAALAAARHQGMLINEIGRLNLEHLAAVILDDAAECEKITMTQRRMALLGPVEGLRLANHAAKKNGMEVRDEFAEILRYHLNDIRMIYAGGDGAGEPYPEPWPGAWGEYAAAIENVIAEGLATGPDNMEFYGAAGGHMLLNRNFYYAISGKNWCWFHFNAEDLLKNYDSFHDWSPLPAGDVRSLDNSEIFSLHLKSVIFPAKLLFSKAEIVALFNRYSDIAPRRITEEMIDDSRLFELPQTWFFYDCQMAENGYGHWGRWFDGLSLAGDEEGYEFPLVGEVKPEYNVRGCAAICRCIDEAVSVANETEARVNWAAAAKPFGTLETLEGERTVVTAYKGFVLPACFEVARLVPLDSVGGQDLATADCFWVVHVREHLGPYLDKGPRCNSCFYCQQLETWERDSFRREGIRWIDRNGDSCVRGTGGSGGHGGTSHGH